VEIRRLATAATVESDNLFSNEVLSHGDWAKRGETQSVESGLTDSARLAIIRRFNHRVQISRGGRDSPGRLTRIVRDVQPFD